MSSTVNGKPVRIYDLSAILINSPLCWPDSAGCTNDRNGYVRYRHRLYCIFHSYIVYIRTHSLVYRSILLAEVVSWMACPKYPCYSLLKRAAFQKAISKLYSGWNQVLYLCHSCTATSPLPPTSSLSTCIIYWIYCQDTAPWTQPHMTGPGFAGWVWRLVIFGKPSPWW